MRRSLRPVGRRLLAFLACAVLLAFTPAVTTAQIDTGGISGTVTDETGAALPGVTVTIANLATKLTRVIVTNERGRYLVSGLPPSQYSVTAELTGFGTVVRPGITVNVGSALDVDIVLRVASLEETLTVTGEAPLVERARTDLSNVVTQEFIDSLPSRNREYLDFALLMPATSENVAAVQGTGVRVGGAPSREGTLLVDGFYNLDEGFTMPKQRHSQDLVQEFQVVSFGGSAEHGRATGGLINVVTKSGGNQLSGSAYGFFRDTALNAQDFGERRRGVAKSNYERQQWGGSFGGPIVSNRSFFFGAFERVSETWPLDNRIQPDHAAAIGLPPEDVGTTPRFFQTWFGFGKWDHNISSNTRLQASYSLTKSIDHQVCCPASLAARSRAYGLYATDESYLAKWTNVARGGRVLHELRGAYFPRRYGARGLSLGGPPLVADGQINQPILDSLFGDRQQLSYSSPPGVTISSVANFGRVSLNNRIYTFPAQALYSSSLFTDRHNVKFGADYMYAYYDYYQFSPYAGAYSFSNLANFQRGVYSQYTQAFGDMHNPRTHQYISAYVQDSWNANDRLTVNYGLRYDLELNPEQKASGIPYGNDYNNIGPRFAISYALTDRGRTFLKITSGVYFDRIWNNATNNLYNLKGHELRVSTTWTPTTPGAPVYPQVFTAMPAIVPRDVINAIIMPDEVNVPRNTQVVGTLEHELRPGVALSTSAIYTRTTNRPIGWDTNSVWSDTARAYVRPDLNYRAINQDQYIGPGEYVAGVVEVRTRGTRMGVNGNLTLSRAYEAINPDDRRTSKWDWAPASDNPTLRGTISGYYNVNQHMQFSGALRSRTGRPVTPTASGIDVNGDGVFGDRTPTFEPGAFEQPAVTSVDVRFTWRVPLASDRRLQFYAEAFNVLNQEGIRTVINDYGADPANPGPRWMEISSYFPPREVNLGVRFTF